MNKNPTLSSHGAETVADVYLRSLWDHGVQWLFCNAGTDFPPLLEAYERAYAHGTPVPTPVLVPHENVAVGMAYGAALVTGEPQVVMVHVGVGTANAVCGLFNAARQHVPVILTAGRTPVLEHGRLGARNNYINWAQEMYDQGGMVRELVKWDYELRDPAQVETVVNRAYSVAASSPSGPAYLMLPRELLSAPALQPELAPRKVSPAATSRPRAEDIAQVSRWLREASRPVIVTSDAGRCAAAFQELAAFAERWAIPVAQYRPRYGNLPTAHSMFAGFNPAPWISDADLVLVLESDVPWIPDECMPPPSCNVVQVGKDPLYTGYPIRSFPSNLTVNADIALFLQDLNKVLLEKHDEAADIHIQRRAQEVALKKQNLTPNPSVPEGLNPRYVSRCLAEFFDEDTVLINEYPFTIEEMPITRHGRFFSHSPAGGLGWATGTALGMKLANPGLHVVAAVGDGSYMFGNPTSAHFVGTAVNLPTLTVIFNNRRWAAVHRATLSMYPEGLAAQAEHPPLSCLEPSPQYEQVVQASGGLGIRVAHIDQLHDAFARAFAAIKRGQQAVVNVETEATYTRTA